MEKIVVAGGCFWGVEEYFRRLQGTVKTRVGYAQSDVKNPSYEQVCEKVTTAVEAVEIYYEKPLTLEKIMEHLFRIIDPTSLNKQGGDIGLQYRSGVYYEETNDGDTIEAYILKQQAYFDKPIVVEVLPLKNFFDAETYHQQYLVKNPTGYCHVNFAKIKPDELKKA